MYNGQAQDVFDDDVAKLKGSAEMNGSIADLQNMKDDGPGGDESSDGSSSNDEGETEPRRRRGSLTRIPTAPRTGRRKVPRLQCTLHPSRRQKEKLRRAARRWQPAQLDQAAH